MEVKASALWVSLLQCLSRLSLPFLYAQVWLSYASSDRDLAHRSSRRQGDWLSGFHDWDGQGGADSSWQCHLSSDILHWGWHFCAYSLHFRYSLEARHPPPPLLQLRLFWGGSRLAEPILDSSLWPGSWSWSWPPWQRTNQGECLDPHHRPWHLLTPFPRQFFTEPIVGFPFSLLMSVSLYLLLRYNSYLKGQYPVLFFFFF